MTVTIEGATFTVTESLKFDHYGALFVRDSSFDVAPILVEESALTATGYINLDVTDDGVAITLVRSTVTSDDGSVRILESTLLASTDYLDIASYGPVLVEGGSLTAGGTPSLECTYAGTITLRGTSSIVAGNMTLYDGGNVYAGSNDIVTLADNASIALTGTMYVDGTYSDLVVRDNGPIGAGIVNWYARAAHVLLSGNERIESAGNVLVYAADPGGRLAATDNLFVANGGAAS